jgi:uncharacterized protein (TIGR03086 family)
MIGPIDLWRQVADKWSEVYDGIDDSHWALETPCAGWRVRDLVDHTLRWQAEGGALLGMTTKPDDEWETIRAAYADHLSDDSNLEGTVDEFAGIPKGDLAGLLIGDLLIHSWDVARSIGADETLPAAPVDAVLAGLRHMPTELLRGHNPLGVPMMGPAVEVPADASAQDQMLAMAGRRP